MAPGVKRLLGFTAAMILLGQAASGQDVLRVRGGPAFSAVFVEWNQEEVTIRTERETKSYFWRQLDPKCVCDLVRHHMENTAAAHWALAQYCAATGLSEEARSEYRQCVEADVSYKGKADAAMGRVEFLALAGGKGPLPPPVSPPTPLFPQPEPAQSPAREPSRAPASPETGIRDVPGADPQRKDGQKVNALLGTQLKTYETSHFILHTDLASSADVDSFRSHSESSYDWLYNALDVRYHDKIWNGKCEVFLFERQGDFQRYAASVDGFAGGAGAGGYFRWQGASCHIAFFKPDPRASHTVFTVFAHELTHAFVECRVHHGVKLWLNEGLAEYLASLQPEGGDKVSDFHRQDLKRMMQAGGLPALSQICAMSGPTLDVAFYSQSWSVVKYLISTDPSFKKFHAFIRALKQGKSDEDAIKEAYGQTLDQVGQAWLGYVREMP